MKTVALFVALLCLSATYAQNSIVGSISDAASEPVSFATIVLNSKADSTMVKANISDIDGKFEFIGIDAGSYYLQVSYVGYETTNTSTFEYDGRSYDLGSITLSEAAEQLDEVVVRAAKPLIQLEADKTVFNVQGSINSTGNDALELLRKAPGVMVDNNDNIMLLGKSGVQIYIDDKPSPLAVADLAAYLRTLQASQIEAIEIITNPSAKYDAEGNAGIINIRLIKDKSMGTNGSITLGARQGLNMQYNGTLTLNHREKNYNVYGNYSYFDGDWENTNDFYRAQSGSFFDQAARNLWSNQSHNARVGADFYVSKKSTIGVLAKANLSTFNSSNRSRAEIGSMQTNALESILLARNNAVGDRDNVHFNTNFVHKGDNGSRFNIDLDYARFRNDEDSFQPNTYWTPSEDAVQSAVIYQIISPTDIDIYTAKVDYSTKLFSGKLETGAKTSYVTTDNNFDFYNIIEGNQDLDINRSNRFDYTEQVNAVYANWNRQFGEKWSFQSGLRMEHTHSKGDLQSAQVIDDKLVERDYVDFFPSAGLSFTPSQTHAWRLNYSRRIERPNYQNLNPFEDKLDELTFEKGNPFLNPQYSNSLSLAHTFKQRLTTTLSYSNTKDVFTPVTDALDERAAFLTYINLAEQKNVSLSVAYPFSVAKWWSVYGNVTGYRQSSFSEFQDKIIDLKVNVLNFYIQNTFTLPKGFKAELTSWYNSPAIWGNWTTSSQYDISVGLQKKILRDKGSLKLSFSDLFLTNPWSGESTFGNFFMTGAGRWDSRQVRLNFKYNFGSKEVKSARQRKTGLEDEERRVGSGN
ncbi:MAG: TonB-dependent receptor [Saprospiraceae bacterium]|nr:TonB-dependent receptor [Saprospiraceae bacterium]